MNKLPEDLIEIPFYNGKYGNVDLKGLMYSPSQKALYNKGFLNKKINLNNKKNFYSYVKSENPMERKRICININRFIRQYPEYQNIQDNYTNEKSIDKSIDEKSDDNKASADEVSEDNSNEKSENNNQEEISENRFIDILSNYKD